MNRISGAILFLVAAGSYGAPAAGHGGPVMLTEWTHDVSPPLREMAAQATGTLPIGTKVVAAPNVTGPVLGINFPGIAADVDPGATPPPDTNGAAGATQYVQWVNTVIAVFDKATGAVLLGPAPGNVLWTNFGGPCQNHNRGQPMAQYDKGAGRWVLAQPVLVTPYTYCIAISKTSDATGPYFRFAFPLSVPAGTTPDSPKLAVWPDAYYTSFNLLQSGSATGALAIAFDRVRMLNGSARSPVAFTLGPSNTYMLPSDWDGAVAPGAGEPDFYMRVGSPSSLQLFKFHVDFNTPENSTFSTQPKVVPITPPPTEIQPDLCTHKPGHCHAVRQPPPGLRLDGLPNALLYRLIWRKIRQKEHLFANQSVFGSQTVASVNWYDIRSPNGAATLAQQGAVGSPSFSYWMGSIASDKNGNLALGFSASGATLFPTIAVTGRLNTDAAGTMAPVQIIVPGTDVQTASGAWGEYSSMSIDPTDDCTFWYTTEFIQDPPAGSTPNWSTWIASLRFPSCH